MGQRRFLIGIGTATLFAGAVAMTAPAATAQELAPGISCDGFTCRNDTDDTYRIDSVATCGVGGNTIYDSVPVSTYVSPRATVDVQVNCPAFTEPGSWESQPPTTRLDGTVDVPPPVFEPGRPVPTFAQTIRHDHAEVDNDPPASGPSGSAG
ncbi:MULTISPECIES: hypothetical protein [unclassified Nocardia]|uniref:hypothetical protein n=1 Tax=unclassified Nocardia TaxID=2637762 RepID=UPI0024A94D4C|nr:MULTISPECIES: hypothetical protein [unclassified Nocardia]